MKCIEIPPDELAAFLAGLTAKYVAAIETCPGCEKSVFPDMLVLISHLSKHDVTNADVEPLQQVRQAKMRSCGNVHATRALAAEVIPRCLCDSITIASSVGNKPFHTKSLGVSVSCLPAD